MVPVDPDRPNRRRGGARVRADVLAAIALGAALGGPARYEMAQLIHGPKNGFPWATFWTNISGSFVLGLVLVVLIERFPPSRYARPFFATGFLGAYTTFSTFAVDTDLLLKAGRVGIAAAYALGSLGGGLVVAWFGILLGRAAGPRASAGTDRR
jgi:CrcB protein